MTKIGSRYAWVVVALAGVLVFADCLLSSQLIGLSYSQFSWMALAGAYDTCSLGDAVDAPQLTWTTGGDAPWVGKKGIGYDGIDAAQSGAIGMNQSSWLQTTVQGPCKITFWCSVSSESGCDFLRFYVDGVEQPGSLSGEVGWKQQMTVVGAGSHVLRWAYIKDLTVSRGSDAAWLDQVQITSGSDTDGDGIPDAWEWRYFGSLDTVTANSDWDHDGAGDISEYYAGTDPTNRLSRLGMNAVVSLSGTNYVIRWSSVTGMVYRLDHSTNLFMGFSPLIDNIAATPPENVYTDNTAGVATKFYRVGLNTGMILIPVGTNSGTDPNFGAYSLVLAGPLLMDRNDVTKAQWDEVRNWGLTHGYTDLSVGGGKTNNHPVQTVSWYDCVKWCNARSEKEGRIPAYYVDSAKSMVYKTGATNIEDNCVDWSNGYRLPMTNEWEYAARGGLSGKRFPWGDTIDHSLANYKGNPSVYSYDFGYAGYDVRYSFGYAYTSPMGSFEAGKNGFGLYDMAGNVYQWCWSWYPGYKGLYRVNCGGCWDGFAYDCLVGGSDSGSPGGAGSGLGFRAVLPTFNDVTAQKHTALAEVQAGLGSLRSAFQAYNTEHGGYPTFLNGTQFSATVTNLTVKYGDLAGKYFKDDGYVFISVTPIHYTLQAYGYSGLATNMIVSIDDQGNWTFSP